MKKKSALKKNLTQKIVNYKDLRIVSDNLQRETTSTNSFF